MKSVVLVFGAAVVLVACSVGSNPVGQACSSSTECQALQGGYCPKAGVCTKACSRHADCGCAAGTESGDIAKGSCDSACVAVTEDTAVCLRTCKNNSDCAAGTKCQMPNSKSGYSVCM